VGGGFNSPAGNFAIVPAVRQAINLEELVAVPVHYVVFHGRFKCCFDRVFLGFRFYFVLISFIVRSCQGRGRPNRRPSALGRLIMK